MKLNIYKASAGSGKTHILAGNYIVESFRRVAPTRSGSPLYDAFKDTMAFARILAVTFTNKAAGEMKERIIKELDKLATGAQSDYVKDICNRYPQYTAEQVAERAKSIRSAILHNYSDFNLRTIDSFVQSIVRAFCYDININSGYSTETDQNAVLADLINALLQKSDTDPELHEQFRAMAAKNVKDGANWDFRMQLTSLANLIFTEQFQNLENFYNGMDDETKHTYFAKSLEITNLIYDDFEEKADNIAAQARAIFDSMPVPPSDINNSMKILHNFLVNNIKACEIGKIIDDLCKGNKWLRSKPTKQESTLISTLQPQIEPLLQEAVSLIVNNGKDYITANIIRRDFHAFMLLGDLARLMPDYRRENRMMLVSDATTFLNAIIAENDAPFIYERVGNRFDHIYIDEFQDTSEFQWNNFRPLIENTLAQGFDNMIVGDVKQAIYRFRGGDWSLLNTKVQEQIGDENINLNTLDVNWRSRKNIVDFNDAIFQKAIDTLAAHGDGELDFSLLKKIYADAFQKLPQKSDRSGGKVDVVFIEGKKNKSKSTKIDEKTDGDSDVNSDDEPDPLEGLLLPDTREDNIFIVKSLNKMAAEIDSLIKQKISPKKIAILVRKGWQASLSVNFLMKYQAEIEGASHYDVISADSLYIANSLIVKILINAMKYVNNPADIIAKIEMMRTYCVVSGKEIDDDGIFKTTADEDLPQGLLPEGFDEIMKSYSDLPLYDLCEKIIACFSLQKYTGDSEYLRTFEDCVLNFTKTFSSDLNRFVKWWDESGNRTAIQPSDEQDAVTIMTIHKSKGLDFSIQFVPFCNWEMEEVNNMQDNYIWVKCPEDSPFASLPVLPVRYNSRLAGSHFANDYIREKRDMYVDSLNLLYVALTRAVDELHIYCPRPDTEKSLNIKTVGDLLYYCITDPDSEENDNNTVENATSKQANAVINLGDFYDAENTSLLMAANHNLERGFRIKDYKGFRVSGFQNAPWESKLAVLSHSSDFFIQNSPFLQERINHGLFMHDVMSRITYAEDAPQILQEMKFQGRITEAQKSELQQLLNDAFQIPQVGQWFSHDWRQIITERALMTTEGNIRIPDRVLVGDKKTVVIDFKFGKERDEYRDQITEYAQLLSKMKKPKYPPVEAYLYYVESGKIVIIL